MFLYTLLCMLFCFVLFFSVFVVILFPFFFSHGMMKPEVENLLMAGMEDTAPRAGGAGEVVAIHVRGWERGLQKMEEQLQETNAHLEQLVVKTGFIEVRTCAHSKDGARWKNRELLLNLVLFAVACWQMKREMNVAVKFWLEFLKSALMKSLMRELKKKGCNMKEED